MRWMVALLWAVPLWGQEIAVEDSVEYNGNRYRVVFTAGAAIFSDDADFNKRRYNPNHVHRKFYEKSPFEVRSWMEPAFVHQDSVAADNPLLRLQKTITEIAAATKTTGLVLYRDEDAAPVVNVPVDDVTKIE